jgi:hypothetical protein
VLGVVVSRVSQYLGWIVEGLQLPGYNRARLIGELQIKEDHVGMQRFRQVQTFSTLGRHADGGPGWRGSGASRARPRQSRDDRR